MGLAGFFTITRPANSLVAGLAAIIAYLIATGTLVYGVLLLMAVVTLVTAAGNVVNDYFDAEIDAINRPERPIPSGAVSRNAALAWAGVLFILGLTIGLFTTPLCLAIALINVLLLVAYAARLKSTPFFGNAAVAYLSASIFLFGGAYAGWHALFDMLPVAAITFLAMLARELLKDAEDIEGDRAHGADTLAIRVGTKKTAVIAFACAVAAVAASVVPFLWWGPWYLVGIALVDLVILLAAGKALGCPDPACLKATGATTLLKLGMFASLVIFTLSAVLLSRLVT
ncbi:geranylgeranylglycerol-phosphate geranylgeranyltransferase [Methanoregula sp.]|uniref:geranylgeranylglycerol-phosphate geranylgeranyltransferase n=1 Tax=Methanoregula sp. TaxID=2052170 RepID=UPI002B871C3C|nr:geranylgeranylglycerol-phosphate geranylgeranyltransferase [Methanoregula sp.]HVP97274.1 geranylgeranylglycerol-phosphate geranylgeranyltransferase [Methanoregula sp.]